MSNRTKKCQWNCWRGTCELGFVDAWFLLFFSRTYFKQQQRKEKETRYDSVLNSYVSIINLVWQNFLPTEFVLFFVFKSWWEPRGRKKSSRPIDNRLKISSGRTIPVHWSIFFYSDHVLFNVVIFLYSSNQDAKYSTMTNFIPCRRISVIYRTRFPHVDLIIHQPNIRFKAIYYYSRAIHHVSTEQIEENTPKWFEFQSCDLWYS